MSRLTILLLTTTTAVASTGDNITVVKQKKHYVTDAEFIVNVPQANVFEAFTQFDRLSAINPVVIHSTADVVNKDTTRVTTKMRNCVGLFCKTSTLVEDVTILANDTIHSTIVQGLGDFDNGNTVWQSESQGDQTRVRYHSRVQPGFWLPPLLGKRAIRKALTRQIITAVDNLEVISQ